MNDSTTHRNRLAEATSPYLLQHAENPVDWYPWGEEALTLARDQDKPILLSIGYSACHWCHVMAHESFEDEATAAVMNELFINIKVDREERPDLDRIYQTAHQLLARRPGGWPLTLFLTPDDQVPFFAGTYFPREPRHGLPAFQELLRRGAQFMRDNREDIRAQKESLLDAFESMTAAGHAPESTLTAAPLDKARAELENAFDEHEGGFGQAPKFPHPTNIERLMRHWAATSVSGSPDQRGLEMALFTLRKMASGGLYDHVGGGFCRYSVDDYWMIPHFEKMLYDNGPLLSLYSDAWQITGEPLFSDAATGTADWIMRDMQDPAGGYYSAMDADSEGEEGRFYVWERETVRTLLDDDEYSVYAKRFGFDRAANFEGKWYPHAYRTIDQVAEMTGLTPDGCRSLLESARCRLFDAREGRVHPGCDDKILGAWNALAIKGMVRAARIFARDDYLESARRSLDFIRTTLWDGNRLRATYRDGKAHLDAYLDDYAYLIDALIELLQADWHSEDLNFACNLADCLLEHFEDQDVGGFFFTAHDHETLIHRPKPFNDEAIPSGNGIAATALARLGHLINQPRYLQAGERALSTAWQAIDQFPHGHNALLVTLEEHLFPPQIIILRGESEALRPWKERALRAFSPSRLCFAIPSGTKGLPDALEQRAPTTAVRAYVCSGTSCQPPLDRFEDFDALLGSMVASAPGPE